MKVDEPETELLLDEIEPKLLRNLPQSFQKFVAIWQRVRDKQRAERENMDKVA